MKAVAAPSPAAMRMPPMVGPMMAARLKLLLSSAAAAG